MVSLNDWIKKVQERKERWQNNGPLMVCLSLSLTAVNKIHKAKEAREQKAQAKAEGDDDEDKGEEVTPLDTDINESLQTNWIEKYFVPLDKYEELPSQLLHSMYKKLKNRRGEAEYPKGIYTKAHKTPPTLSMEGKKPKQKISPLLDIVINSKDTLTAPGSEPSFHIDRSPWLYLIALENMLRSFCLAGSFKTQDPEAEPLSKDRMVLMVCRIPVETHLKRCRAFALDWANRTNRPSDAFILTQLRRVDMNIRTKWWDLFTANKPKGRTFTSCMEASLPYAEQQWDTDFTPLLKISAPATPPQNGDWGAWSRDSPKKANRNKGKGKGKDKGVRKKTKTKGGGKGQGGKR